MNRILSYLPTALIALVFGFLGAWGFSQTGMANSGTREWLMDNPDILPAMAEAYRDEEAKKRMAGIAGEIETPFPGAVLGNPKGTVTLVEFSDYACGFCRQSVPDIKALIAANPDLKVVMREWPIFQGSDVPARLALAAAKQGKYAAFHDALFAAGPPTEATMMAAAQKAGVDLEVAKAFMGSREVEAELQKNQRLAMQLGYEGTPGWVVGSKVFAGAVGRTEIGKAIEDARGS